MDENNVWQITGGQATEEEVAAVGLVLSLAAQAARAQEKVDDRPLAGGWNTYIRAMRRSPAPGREAWRFSARP